MGLGGRPGENAGATVDRCAARSTDQTISESIRGQVGIGGAGGEGEQGAFVQGLGRDDCEDRSRADFIDCDGDQLVIGQNSIAHLDGEVETAGTLGLGGRPGENAGAAVDG